MQLAPAASVSPQVLVSAKSAAFGPPTEIPETVIIALPVFDSVTVCALVVTPVTMLPKLKLVAEMQQPVLKVSVQRRCDGKGRRSAERKPRIVSNSLRRCTS